MQIQETKDYSRFYYLESNRPIDWKHVRELAAAIAIKNLLHLNPITVKKDGGVIDGQHRLEAAKMADVPIFFQEDDDISEEDLSILNTNNKNWSLGDFLHNRVSRGNKEYIEVSRFLDEYPKIPLTTALTMLSREPKNLNLFKRGEYAVTNYDEAIQVAEQLDKLAFYNEKLVYQSSFTGAYIIATRIEGFIPAKFLHQVSQRPRKLVPCVSQQEYLNLFEEIFNYNNKTGNFLSFRIVKSKAKKHGEQSKSEESKTSKKGDSEQSEPEPTASVQHEANAGEDSSHIKETEVINYEEPRQSDSGPEHYAKSGVLKKPEFQFDTKEVDTKEMTPIKINRKTTIYAKPGEDPEEVKANFLKRYNGSKGVLNLD